jgi:hypothetical protein
LITLSASANAATVLHSRTHHDVIIVPGVSSSFAAVPGWGHAPPRAYAPSQPPVHYDDTRSYDDPAKFGG